MHNLLVDVHDAFLIDTTIQHRGENETLPQQRAKVFSSNHQIQMVSKYREKEACRMLRGIDAFFNAFWLLANGARPAVDHGMVHFKF